MNLHFCFFGTTFSSILMNYTLVNDEFVRCLDYDDDDDNDDYCFCLEKKNFKIFFTLFSVLFENRDEWQRRI